MTTSYPGSLDSYTDKQNKQDVYDATHINDLQDAVVAIETELGTDPAGTRTDLVQRLSISLANNGAIAQGTSFPVSPSPVEGQPFYRTDENTYYIYDGSSWVAFGVANNEVLTTSGTWTAP